MNEQSVRFELKGREVFVYGYPELEGRKGTYGILRIILEKYDRFHLQNVLYT